SAALCKAVTAAWRRGRVDGVIQSTDKNFMVPVGGAIICAGKKDSSLVEAVNKAYPGRASMSPLLDVLITLLSLGNTGWRRLLCEREEVYTYMKTSLGEVAARYGERALSSPKNPISIGMSLSALEEAAAELESVHSPADAARRPEADKAAGDNKASVSSDTLSAEQAAAATATAGEEPRATSSTAAKQADSTEATSSMPTAATSKAVTFLGAMLFQRWRHLHKHTPRLGALT
ncbi:hypothetical protein CYMTET_29016, partial [Cymbomonas tetramitiformis]